MVQILIPSSMLIDTKLSSSFTVYCIETYLSGKCYKVNRRYRDFDQLHKILKKYSFNLPYLPPKKVRNFNKKFIEQRRINLEKYLQTLLRTIQLSTCKELNEFLLPINLSSLTSSLNNTNNNTDNLKSSNLSNTTSVFSLQSISDQSYPFVHNTNQIAHQSMISIKNDYVLSIDYNDLPCSETCSTNVSTKSSCDSYTSGSSSNSSSLPDIILRGALDAIYTNGGNFKFK